MDAQKYILSNLSLDAAELVPVSVYKILYVYELI